MTAHFQLGQHARHDRNVWYCVLTGEHVTDERAIAQYEAEYRAHQRAHTPRGPRAPLDVPMPRDAPLARAHHKTPREWKGEAK